MPGKPKTTRRRDTPGLITQGYLRYSTLYKPTGTKNVHFDGLGGPFGVKPGTQTTVSEGHPFHSRSKGNVQDIGGEFFTERTYAEVADRKPQVMGVRNEDSLFVDNVSYKGHIYPINPAILEFPTSIASTNSELDKAGATAIARCKPTNSVADVATFLGELVKDRIPDLPGSATWQGRNLTARNAGKDFLNAEFGWLPLVNDVKSFSKAVSQADAVLKQYERDAGKVVRRNYNFPIQKETSQKRFQEFRSAFYQPGNSLFGNTDLNKFPLGDVDRIVETTRRQWFSGAFTYALPSGYDSRNALDRYALMAKHVFGASLSPDVLWELAPWSWAIDWFSNAGDVISNISDWQSDGLVMRYGYMMEHTIVKHTYILPLSGLKNNSVKVQPLTLVNETKIRRKANPFGFGLTWNGLSPLQLAIAAAIGVTR